MVTVIRTGAIAPIDDSHMTKIERHVCLVGLGANEDDRLVKGVREAKLIKHVGAHTPSTML